MFNIIPGGPKLYNIPQLSKTIGCKITDFHLISSFISAWVQAFHPVSMGWFNPEGPDTSIRYSTTEYPDTKGKR